MHIGLNYIYPFYLLPAPLFTCRLGDGAAERGREAAVFVSVGLSSEAPSCRTAAASLAQAPPALAALQTPNELSSVRPGR